MNTLLDSEQYKRMEEIVLGELQYSLIRSKLALIDNEILSHYPDLDNRTLVLEGLLNYFSNFIFRFPEWPLNERIVHLELMKVKINPSDEKTQNFLKLQKRLDKLILEAGLDKNKVKGLLSKFHKNRTSESHFSFLDYVFPLYVALRSEGYTYKELTRGNGIAFSVEIENRQYAYDEDNGRLIRI